MVLGQLVLLALLLVIAAWSSTTGVAQAWGPSLGGDRWRVVAATVLVLGGALLLVVSARQLGTALTPHPQPRAEATLRTDGLYAAMRHPVYTGVLAVGWGLAVWAGLLVSVALAVALTCLLVVKARYEEQLLTERYPQYPSYAATTGRFLPRLGRRRRPAGS
jgi:protein-S-isoprenylcysteine O-methyltransferase Ste14